MDNDAITAAEVLIMAIGDGIASAQELVEVLNRAIDVVDQDPERAVLKRLSKAIGGRRDADDRCVIDLAGILKAQPREAA